MSTPAGDSPWVDITNAGDTELLGVPEDKSSPEASVDGDDDGDADVRLRLAVEASESQNEGDDEGFQRAQHAPPRQEEEEEEEVEEEEG